MGERLRGALWGWKLPAANCSFYSSGQCGVAEATARAVAELNGGQVEWALVGAVDSMVEEGTLQWLIDTGRLKLEGMPAGLRPGEAAGFFVLERRERNRLATVAGVHQAVEEATLLSGRPPLGIGLAKCLGTAIAAKAVAARPIWVLADQNGEPYRAAEWGLALNRLLPKAREWNDVTVWYPSASFGDTGAASGMMAVCAAVQAFARGYAPSDNAFVVTSSDDKERATIRLRA